MNLFRTLRTRRAFGPGNGDPPDANGAGRLRDDGPLRHPRRPGPPSNYAPIAKYDTLTVEQIRAALGRADANTIKRVREYERKFAKRGDVLDVVEQATARIHKAAGARR